LEEAYLAPVTIATLPVRSGILFKSHLYKSPTVSIAAQLFWRSISNLSIIIFDLHHFAQVGHNLLLLLSRHDGIAVAGRMPQANGGR
jgi:hypothetical protein